MTDAQARETAGLLDPERLRWFTPELADEGGGEGVGAVAHAFRIGERWFLVPMDLPAEACPAMFCARLPFTRPWCLGLANFRGELVPVYDLGGLIDNAAGRRSRYFLVLGRRDARACLCIDEITTVRIPVDASPQNLPPLPNLPEGLPCQGLRVDGETYAEVDLGGLLTILAGRAGLF